MFNAAFLNRPVSTREDLWARLAGARELFQSRELPWAFWIGENWLARPARRVLAGTCDEFGLRAVAEMPGMVADAIRVQGRLSRRRGAPRIDIVRAGSTAAMEDFRMIGSSCFHVPPAWFREVFDDSMPSRQFACWVGYCGEQPVSTAATVVSNGVIGLYNVATLPGERGRGFAETITRHAIAEASLESGFKRVILQSTVHGERLYKRLGFREVSRVVVFNSIAPG
jgi:hypothetical protein